MIRASTLALLAALCTIAVVGTAHAAPNVRRADPAPANNPPSTSGPPGTSVFGVRAALHGKTTLKGDAFSYAIPAGTHVTDAIDIINDRNTDLRLVVYGADLVGRGRAVAPAQQSDPQRDVGAWIRVLKNNVTVPARGTVPVPFALAVPSGTPPGDHLGAVVASTVVGRSASGLAIETRAAITVQVHIPGTVRVGLAVTRFDVHDVSGGREFVATVHNTGNVLVTLQGKVTLSLGHTTIELEPQSMYVIPDGETSYTATWHDTPRFGRVNAVAVFDAFINDKPRGEFRSATKRIWFIDWPTVTTVLVVVIAAIGMWLVTRERRKRRRVRRKQEREVLRDYWAGIAPPKQRSAPS